MSYLEEYKSLREEILYYYKSRDQITFVLLSSSYGIAGYNIWKSQNSVLALFLPIIISLFAYFFFSVRTLIIHKLESYIRVYLEKQINGFNWYKVSEGFNIGITYKVSKIIFFILFLLPTAISLNLILKQNNGMYNWIISIVIITFIVSIETSKIKTLHQIDERMRKKIEHAIQ